MLSFIHRELESLHLRGFIMGDRFLKTVVVFKRWTPAKVHNRHIRFPLPYSQPDINLVVQTDKVIHSCRQVSAHKLILDVPSQSFPIECHQHLIVPAQKQGCGTEELIGPLLKCLDVNKAKRMMQMKLKQVLQ